MSPRMETAASGREHYAFFFENMVLSNYLIQRSGIVVES